MKPEVRYDTKDEIYDPVAFRVKSFKAAVISESKDSHHCLTVLQ